MRSQGGLWCLGALQLLSGWVTPDSLPSGSGQPQTSIVDVVASRIALMLASGMELRLCRPRCNL